MSPTRLALLELACTLALPLLVLQFGTSTFGPVGVVVAAAVPVGAFVLGQMVWTRTVSALGVISLFGVGLSGGVAMLRLDTSWFAWKEALLPVLVGCATAATALGPWPLVGVVLERVLDPAALDRAAAEPDRRAAYTSAIRRSTVEFGVASAAPAVLAFALARILVVSEAGTEAWAEEIGRYSVWSVPAVSMPAVVLAVVAFRRAMALVEQALGVEFETLLPDLME
jgi:hypothetical protein